MNDDRRARRTKRQLRQALTELLRQKPLSEITVTELAELADLNRGTFYLHYRDIGDLFERVEDELFSEFMALLDRYPLVGEGRDSISRLFREVFEFIGQNADLASILLNQAGGESFIKRIISTVRDKSISEWRLALPGYDQRRVEYLFEYVVGGCIAILRYWFSTGCVEPTAELAELAEELMAAGFDGLA